MKYIVQVDAIYEMVVETPREGLEGVAMNSGEGFVESMFNNMVGNSDISDAQLISNQASIIGYRTEE